jgi:hypothetical protein
MKRLVGTDEMVLELWNGRRVDRTERVYIEQPPAGSAEGERPIEPNVYSKKSVCLRV